jgi:chemotaxis protein histidine kinase CheA
MPQDTEDDTTTLIILAAHDQEIALQVNEVFGREEAEIQHIPENALGIRGVTGVCVRGDGGVCLVLEPVMLK